MSDTPPTAGERALLPAGLADLLAPAAREEAAVVERLMAACEAEGYERVKPPLLEFESTLIAGAGAAVAEQTFRLMDPVSQRMLGLRADMTPQVARIAAFRLGGAPRPLRLCYAGQVLRVKGSQLRPERQFGQVGAELIGADGAAADAEACLLAARALLGVGVQGLTLDLTLPTLVSLVADALALPAGQRRDLRQALDGKDAAAVAAAAGPQAATFLALLRCAGPSPEALGTLQALALPAAAAAEVARLVEAAGRIAAALPELVLTVDPVEHRGYEYHSGLSFTLFARGVRGELGRGGRYLSERAEGPAEAAGGGEPATGFTLYMDTVLAAVPARPGKRRIFLPAGTPPRDGERLRDAGWITVADLAAAPDAAAEGRRLNCSHVWRDGETRSLLCDGSL
jgi:ATP phosphoribosyltransferase regulatory subunit